MDKWSVVYEKAIRDDGSLFFPERLTKEFLDQAKRVMGSYMFANQYQNEIIPQGEQTFKKEWIRYYKAKPELKTTFAMIDPAISQQDNADFTALVVVDCDVDGNWYVRSAMRYKITPTQIVNLCFKVWEKFKPQAIGIEDVAYQKALLYMLDEEMKRRNAVLPVTGVKPDSDKSKEIRILGLVPRFEWGRILLAQGLHDLELELAQFPRSKNDDLLDALAYIERIAFYPQKERSTNEPPNPNDPANYERWYRQNISKIREGRINPFGRAGEFGNY